MKGGVLILLDDLVQVGGFGECFQGVGDICTGLWVGGKSDFGGGTELDFADFDADLVKTMQYGLRIFKGEGDMTGVKADAYVL